MFHVKIRGVTLIDSIVTTATAVSQRSMVNAVQKGAVNCQSVLSITVERQIWAGVYVKSKVRVQSTVKPQKRASQGLG